MRVQYHPAIEGELLDIINYYNDCCPGLGQHFLQEFEGQVLRVLQMPYRFVVIRGDIRRSLMKRFPFSIYFRIVSDDILRITVIKHHRSHPEYGLWRV